MTSNRERRYPRHYHSLCSFAAWLTNLPTFLELVHIFSEFVFVLICFLSSSDIIRCILILSLICEIPPSREDSIFSGEFTPAYCGNFSVIVKFSLSNMNSTSMNMKYVTILSQQFRTDSPFFFFNEAMFL